MYFIHLCDLSIQLNHSETEMQMASVFCVYDVLSTTGTEYMRGGAVDREREDANGRFGSLSFWHSIRVSCEYAVRGTNSFISIRSFRLTKESNLNWRKKVDSAVDFCRRWNRKNDPIPIHSSAHFYF